MLNKKSNELILFFIKNKCLYKNNKKINMITKKILLFLLTELINAEKERISQELENVKQQLPTKLQEFTLAKEERLVIQPTIQQRVDEFSAYNYILHEVVPTLPQDRQKFVEVPAEKLPIVPSVKEIAKVIEEAVIEKEEPVGNREITLNRKQQYLKIIEEYPLVKELKERLRLELE
jgi:hypothetical protein